MIRVETDPTDPTGVYRQEDNISVVIRVETDPTDPTGVYRQDDNIVEVPDNEVTVSSQVPKSSVEFLRVG